MIERWVLNASPLIVLAAVNCEDFAWTIALSLLPYACRQLFFRVVLRTCVSSSLA